MTGASILAVVVLDGLLCIAGPMAQISGFLTCARSVLRGNG